jgi:hypothetical protein
VLDDEHAIGGRICLERDGYAPFVITCGIYGWLVHTRVFSDEAEARLAYDAMKEALDTVIESIPKIDEPNCDAKTKEVPERLRAFVKRFP